MLRWFNILVQGVASLGQVANIVSGFVPPKYQVLIATVLGAFQAVVAVISHNYNPDGTPATTPYVPKA